MEQYRDSIGVAAMEQTETSDQELAVKRKRKRLTMRRYRMNKKRKQAGLAPIYAKHIAAIEASYQQLDLWNIP